METITRDFFLQKEANKQNAPGNDCTKKQNRERGGEDREKGKLIRDERIPTGAQGGGNAVRPEKTGDCGKKGSDCGLDELSKNIGFCGETAAG